MSGIAGTDGAPRGTMDYACVIPGGVPMPRHALVAALLAGAFAAPALAQPAECLPSGRLAFLGVQREPIPEGGLRVSILLQNNQPVAQTYNVTYVGAGRPVVGNFRRRVAPGSQAVQWVANLPPGTPHVTDQEIVRNLRLICE
jgi:hypothetical protein